VSDFLSRIAARAAGRAPLARPRMPALFEAAGAAADRGIDVVDEELVATRTPAAAPADAPPRVDEEAHPAQERGVQSPPTVKPEHTAAVRSPGRARATSAPPPRPTEHAAVQADASVSPQLVPARVPDAAVPVTVALAAPVTAARRVPVPFEAAPPVAVSPVREEPPTVRVHIGRLEVRANLQHAPPQPLTRDEAPPKGTSLADYLRGNRVAG
jgi:hypothetical protein